MVIVLLISFILLNDYGNCVYRILCCKCMKHLLLILSKLVKHVDIVCSICYKIPFLLKLYDFPTFCVLVAVSVVNLEGIKSVQRWFNKNKLNFQEQHVLVSFKFHGQRVSIENQPNFLERQQLAEL